MKQTLNQRYIYKIKSSYIKRCKGKVEFKDKDIIKNVKNRYIVGYGDSNNTRMIRVLTKSKYDEAYINDIKQQIKNKTKILKKCDNADEIKKLNKEIKKLIQERYIASLIPEICNVTFTSDKDYDKYSEEGFYLNGEKYVLLIGTTGGVKGNSVLFMKEKIHDALWEHMKCDADFSTPIIPSKLMAYMSLTLSQSTPVTNPKGILVVKDVETKFVAPVNYLKFNDEDKDGEPILKLIEDYEVVLNACDGCGMIIPSLADQWVKDLQEDYPISAFCVRYAWVKGMLTRFDFRKYCKEVLNTTVVKDVWGQEHNLDDVEIILNESMLKYWKAYNSIDEYVQACEKHMFNFAVTKTTVETLENERALNYQYIQCLNLSDEDIDNLLANDIQEIKDILGMDYRKSILFSKGKDLNEKNAWSGSKFNDDIYAKALMVNKECIKDSYIKDRIKRAISKRIDMLKTGKIKVQGNYQIDIGEPVIQLESMCGFEPKGLLGAGEFYIEYWRQKGVDKVGGFRSPMSCKENARVMKICNREEVVKWYGHLYGVIIFNAWDTAMMAFNGCDFDGDLNFTTDNEIIVNGIFDLPAICCEGKSTDKISNVTKEHFKTCIKKSFGNKVGGVTNVGSSCYDTLAKFEEGSPEYMTLDYRIKCIQLYQQECIDSVKTGEPPQPIPKHWHQHNCNFYKDENVTEEEKEFHHSIISDKKPYYFIYIYDSLKKEYNNFMKSININCARRFKCKIEDLFNKDVRTEEEEEFVKWYYKMNPVSENPCIVNKIAWKVEKAFADTTKISNDEFDYSIYQNPNCLDIIGDSKDRKAIKDLYEEYKKNKTNQYTNVDYSNKEDGFNSYEELMDVFKNNIKQLIPDEQKLLNTLLDMGYNKGSISKNIVWVLAGDIIMNNMLKGANYQIEYPTRDEYGDIEFGGEMFKMVNMEVDRDDL